MVSEILKFEIAAFV